MRSDLDHNRIRNPIFATAKLYAVENLAIAANQTLVAGMPYLLGFDPASTGRNITMYTPGVTALAYEHEIVNYSTGTGVLTILSPAAATIGTIPPGGRAIVRWFNGAWQVFSQLSAGTGGQFNTVAAQYTLSVYAGTYATIANTHEIGVIIPHNFILRGVGLRCKIPVTTGSKAATLTARVNGVACTGGVISATSAGQTPTNTRQSGTAITAGNTGTAGQVVSVLVSAVTAFSEGDGYVEFDLTNTSLTA